MSASTRLEVAGQAAELLEEMGFVSVARLSEGVVTLECWERSGHSARMVRVTVADEAATSQRLAEACASALIEVAGDEDESASGPRGALN